MLGSSAVVSAHRSRIWEHSYVISGQITRIANEAYLMPYSLREYCDKEQTRGIRCQAMCRAGELQLWR